MASDHEIMSAISKAFLADPVPTTSRITRTVANVRNMMSCCVR